MFFTRKDRAAYDAAITKVSTFATDTSTIIQERITSEVSKLEERIDAVLAEIKKEAEPVEYDIKRVTDNDQAAAQKESA